MVVKALFNAFNSDIQRLFCKSNTYIRLILSEFKKIFVNCGKKKIQNGCEFGIFHAIKSFNFFYIIFVVLLALDNLAFLNRVIIRIGGAIPRY